MLEAELRTVERKWAAAAAAFRRHYPLDTDGHRCFRAAAADLCQRFFAEQLGDVDAHTRLDKDEFFWQVFSEMLVANALWNVGLKPTHRKIGPDFLVDHEGRRIWIEVICPEPTVSIPKSWFGVGLKSLPHEEILLRWTNAINTKTKKLLGPKGYIAKGVVHVDDAYVIAVNGRLLRGVFPQLEGISQFPFAVEATFPVGPLEARLTPIGTPEEHFPDYQLAEVSHSKRESILKTNSEKEAPSSVSTTAFLNKSNAPISAIWALDLDESALLGEPRPMALIHNPFATNPVPCGWLPAYAEYAGLQEGQRWIPVETKGRLTIG